MGWWPKVKVWIPASVWAGFIFFLSSRPLPAPRGIFFWDVVFPYLAHLTEYGVLFVLLWRVKKKPWFCFWLALFYAFSDEWHQSFVPTRTASLVDVFVDGLGVVLAWIGIRHVKLRHVPLLLPSSIGICGMEVITDSAAKTQGLGRKLAQRLKGGEVIGLIGDLGSGKTTFVQGLAKGLGIKQRVISPTFVFIRPHSLLGGQGILYHVDLYRIRDLDDIETLGLKEIWLAPKNIVVIEWAEKIEKILPKKTIRAYFEYFGEKKRRIKISNF